MTAGDSAAISAIASNAAIFAFIRVPLGDSCSGNINQDF
jgi:hypothetical protein